MTVSSGSIYDPDSLTRHRRHEESAYNFCMTDSYCQPLNAYRKGGYGGFQGSQQEWQCAGRKKAKKLVFP